MWQRVKNYYHLLHAVAANIRHGFPGGKLIVIGVTGTDGKTTTVNLIYHILKTAGKSVSAVSTVGVKIHANESPLGFHVTTPSSWQLQKFLKAATEISTYPNYLVLEVTSHAIDQKRIWGIPFTIGVLTNITHEHLDYHKSYENYLRTKVKLLQWSPKVVINKDDSSYEKVLSYIQNKSKKILTYGINTKADITPNIFPFRHSLVGEFNIYNILAALAVCRLIGLNDIEILKGIETFRTPIGRMNNIPNNRGIKIYIDYAHTANGIEVALKALKSISEKSRLIAIIGAEGYRDEKKRPVIGEIAVKLADYVIITAVDPRGLITEINTQILEGTKKAGGKIGENVFVENDRQKAIDIAINKLARKGDVIAILGKGHERSMNLDGIHELPWSDFQAVGVALKSL